MKKRKNSSNLDAILLYLEQNIYKNTKINTLKGHIFILNYFIRGG